MEQLGLWVKQLRVVCRDRRLECKGLRRPELTELLSVNDDDVIVSSDDRESDDNEIPVRSRIVCEVVFMMDLGRVKPRVTSIVYACNLKILHRFSSCVRM